MLASAASTAILEAARIPYVTAVEAHTLLRTELERLLALAERLDPVDWAKPTACALWTVRDMLAHQAGGYASGTGYGATPDVQKRNEDRSAVAQLGA